MIGYRHNIMHNQNQNQNNNDSMIRSNSDSKKNTRRNVIKLKLVSVDNVIRRVSVSRDVRFHQLIRTVAELYVDHPTVHTLSYQKWQDDVGMVWRHVSSDETLFSALLDHSGNDTLKLYLNHITAVEHQQQQQQQRRQKEEFISQQQLLELIPPHTSDDKDNMSLSVDDAPSPKPSQRMRVTKNVVCFGLNLPIQVGLPHEIGMLNALEPSSAVTTLWDSSPLSVELLSACMARRDAVVTSVTGNLHSGLLLGVTRACLDMISVCFVCSTHLQCGQLEDMVVQKLSLITPVTKSARGPFHRVSCEALNINLSFLSVTALIAPSVEATSAMNEAGALVLVDLHTESVSQLRRVRSYFRSDLATYWISGDRNSGDFDQFVSDAMNEPYFIVCVPSEDELAPPGLGRQSSLNKLRMVTNELEVVNQKCDHSQHLCATCANASHQLPHLCQTIQAAVAQLQGATSLLQQSSQSILTRGSPLSLSESLSDDMMGNGTLDLPSLSSTSSPQSSLKDERVIVVNSFIHDENEGHVEVSDDGDNDDDDTGNDHDDFKHDSSELEVFDGVNSTNTSVTVVVEGDGVVTPTPLSPTPVVMSPCHANNNNNYRETPQENDNAALMTQSEIPFVPRINERYKNLSQDEKLAELESMGYGRNRSFNKVLLEQFNGDVEQVIDAIRRYRSL